MLVDGEVDLAPAEVRGRTFRRHTEFDFRFGPAILSFGEWKCYQRMMKLQKLRKSFE